MDQRPRTVDECPDGPCPWFGCRHHLGLDIIGRHRIRLRTATNKATRCPTENVSDAEVAEALDGETCSLRAAADGPLTLDEAGQLMGYTRERMRQLEQGAIEAMRGGLLALDSDA